MCYPDYPFPDYPESYVKSGKVLKYLEDFATQFNLRQFIKVKRRQLITQKYRFLLFQFNRCVLEVRPVTKLNSNNFQWKIKTLDIVSKVEETELFDAVMICNG